MLRYPLLGRLPPRADVQAEKAVGDDAEPEEDDDREDSDDRKDSEDKKDSENE